MNSRFLGCGLVGALFAAPLATTAHAQSPVSAARKIAPFRVLDNDEGSHIDLLFPPIRPLLVLPSGTVLALNGHDSALVELDSSGAVTRTIRLPWGPVSLAPWDAEGAEDGSSVLVACRGTYTLARVDLAAGAIVDLIDLPTEPADLLVHPVSGHAFVSCPGADLVVEVDVAARAIVRKYAIDSKAPTFLALQGDDVLVAPMLSGNNSLVETGDGVLDQGAGRVLDLEDPAVATAGLPDEDLFRITPGAEAVAVATDMGTVLFAVGLNPLTGEVWQLGTEADNKDPLRVGEPAVAGTFALNRLALARVTPGAGAPVRPYRVIELDDSSLGAPGIQYDPTRTVGQPYALDFDAAGGGYVVGLLTSNVTQLGPFGTFVREWNVGSIPRAIDVSDDGREAWVYCWGDNTLERYDLSGPTPALAATLDMGFDPTPPDIQEGRRLYYDAAFSEHGNLSCNSCHIELDSDMTAWDLSGLPFDDKGPLVTQTLRGIEDLLPMHWRGERGDLIDFNPAFVGLLGGRPMDESPGGEFEKFQAFVFSVHQPANPFEDPRRVVNAAIGFSEPGGEPQAADAIAGQDAFFDTTSDIIASCNDCHTLPTGTSNEIVLDEPNLADPRRNHKVVASFNGIWRKGQPTMPTVMFADGGSEERPTLGSAISSAGLKDSIKDFVDIPLFTLTEAQRRDISAFVTQIDSGLAPAVHRAWLLDGDAPRRVYGALRTYLMPQAQARHCDVAVFGTVEVDGAARELRWFWDRATGRFVPEDSALASRPLEFFVQGAAQGLASNVFLGLPVGMAERFAVDFDHDDLKNADELALGTDPFDPDSDGDGDPDGHEAANGGDPTDDSVTSTDATPPVIENLRVVYTTTRVAKILFDTAEPTRFLATWSGGGRSGAVSSERFDKKHTVLLRDLVANRVQSVQVTAIDHGGNRISTDVPGIRTEPFVFPFDVILVDATVSEQQDSAGVLRFELRGRVQLKTGGSASGYQLRVDVFKNGVLTQPNVIGSTSGGGGFSTVVVEETGLVPGDEITANVRALWTPGAGPRTWSMPDTPPENRAFSVTYTGSGS